MNTLNRILVIDDESQIQRLLEISLTANGYNIISANNGKDGLVKAATKHPSLIILDLGLPDVDGQDILLKLREWYSQPIIILSVKNAEDEIVLALDNGANDYMLKPFRTNELLARIRVALKHSSSDSEKQVVEIEDISIDFFNHIVKKNGNILKLTSTEYSLLCLLIKNEGRVLTHQFILKEVWGLNYSDQTQYLRVFVRQLRKKIEDDPSNPKLLITESGIGYRFI